MGTGAFSRVAENIGTGMGTGAFSSFPCLPISPFFAVTTELLPERLCTLTVFWENWGESPVSG
ncbi:MAG: hypothetical protein HC903_27685 [Methylacidiphilales bacterium]|nr:hypothetical protein [Candidatus Methylacidiphilales bacterium]